MRHGKRGIAMALALACISVSGSYGADTAAEKKRKKPPAPKPVEAGRVYTQSDLERVIQQAKEAPLTPLPPAEPPGKPVTVTAQAKPPAPPKPSKEEAPLSFGNEDLERMFGKVETKPAPEAGDAGAPQLGDPLSEVADWQAQRTAATLAREKASARVKELEGQVSDLEKIENAVRNPYLARPEPPAGLQGSWDKLSGAERVAAIDARLADLRGQLAKARQDAAKAETDAQAASAPPAEAKKD